MGQPSDRTAFSSAPDLDQVVDYCLGKAGAEATYPWGPAELVPKVGGKAFAFIGLESATIGVKSGRTADEAATWREQYPYDITVSAHIGRYGWNSINITGKVAPDDLQELIDASYDEVVARLPKSKRPTQVALLRRPAA